MQSPEPVIVLIKPFFYVLFFLFAGLNGEAEYRHFCSCCTSCVQVWHSLQAFGSVSGADIPNGDCTHIQCLQEYLHWPNSNVYASLIEDCDDFEVGRYIYDAVCLCIYTRMHSHICQHSMHSIAVFCQRAACLCFISHTCTILCTNIHSHMCTHTHTHTHVQVSCSQDGINLGNIA
jgi:hypothetical protein